MPLSFAPGEAFQFNWSHEVILLSGVTVIVKVVHVRLCHSRMLFVRAYPRETQESVLDANARMRRVARPVLPGGIERGASMLAHDYQTALMGRPALFRRVQRLLLQQIDADKASLAPFFLGRIVSFIDASST